MKIVPQIFGLGAMLCLFTIYQQKTRKRMLLAKLSADVCWTLHYLFLGGFAGMIPNTVGIFRELVFVNRKEKKWASAVIWPVLFIALNFCLGMRTFHSVYNLLPITASAFVTVSLWIDNPKLTKIITLPVCLAFMVYDFYVHSYVGIVNEALSILSILISFIKERKKKDEA